jgi:cysteine desulfurase
MKILEGRHYFDWAAAAPCVFSGEAAPFGNPSSHHREGREAKEALEEARTRCAAALNVSPDTLFFTSGGTEANSIALFSNLMRKQGRTLASAAEHSSIRDAMRTLDKCDKPTGIIQVDSMGRVNADIFEKTLDKYNDARFASIMAVNNETGSITDIPSLLTRNIHLHCDMVQAAGKIPFELQKISSASFSAHKLGGPRGIGLLYLRRPIEIFYSGGGQEKKIRGGTENVQGAIAFTACLEAVQKTEAENYAQARSRMNKLISFLAPLKRVTVIPEQRLECEDSFSPYILQAAFNDIPGEVMARALDDLGFAVSTGSACSSSSPKRPVLEAMGISEKLQIEGIRISQGFNTTDLEIDLLIEAIKEVLRYL